MLFKVLICYAHTYTHLNPCPLQLDTRSRFTLSIQLGVRQQKPRKSKEHWYLCMSPSSLTSLSLPALLWHSIPTPQVSHTHLYSSVCLLWIKDDDCLVHLYSYKDTMLRKAAPQMMDGCMDARCMDGCMGGCMGAWMDDAWMHGCMHRYMRGCMHAWVHAWMHAWMHAWKNCWIDWWTDGWRMVGAIRWRDV